MTIDDEERITAYMNVAAAQLRRQGLRGLTPRDAAQYAPGGKYWPAVVRLYKQERDALRPVAAIVSVLQLLLLRR